jgi:glycosyltransferase involved in cell wall biosynthesis
LLEADVACELHIYGAPHHDNLATDQELDRRLLPLTAARAAVRHGEVADGAAAMQELDILAAPSTRPDPFPLSVLEAMAAGLAVVATDVGGHREAVTDGVDGLLVPPDDIEALTASLQRLIEDESLLGDLGRAARTVVAEKFSIETYSTGIVAAAGAVLR